MKIAIFEKENSQDYELRNKITSLAQEHSIIFDESKPDVVFFIGGDGTFLRAVQHYLDQLDRVIFVGINRGKLGFFYDYDPSSVEELFSQLVEKKISLHEFSLLKGEFIDEEKEKKIYAVNEIRIENPFHTLISDVLIDGELLETFRGNGLLVSSSLGSTAYNKSLGGAIVHHSLSCLQFKEIAPIQNRELHSLGNSLILPSSSRIVFRGHLSNVVIGYDHLICQSKNLKEIAISLSSKKVRVYYSPSHTYLSTVRKGFIE